MENNTQRFFREHYNKNDSGLAFLFNNIFTIGFAILLVVIVSMFTDASSAGDQLWYLILTALVSQLSFLCSAFFTTKLGGVKYIALNVKKEANWKVLLLCVGVSLICFFGLYNLVGVFDYTFLQMGYVDSAIGLPLNTIGDLFLNLLLLAVLPAICEEVVFRGVIFNGLRKNHPDTIAVIFSALLFAFMHGSLSQLVYPFIMGCVFSLVVLRTGNVLYSMIIHLINNSLVILFSYFGVSFSLPMTWWGILVSILIATTAFGVLYLLDKFVFKHKAEDSMKIEKENDSKPNLAMLIGIALAGLIFIINVVGSFVGQA